MNKKMQTELEEIKRLIIKQNSEIETMKVSLSQIYEKLLRMDWEPNQNIRQKLFHLAGLETAEFITKNMNKVTALNDTLKILDLALSKVTLTGLYLEFGVFSGTTINHIAQCVPDQTIYGFDSFEGLPEDWRTGYEKGTFKRNDLPEVKENVNLVKGWFDDTLPQFIKEHREKCAFIHIDCDIYSSTKCIFENLQDQIVSGTIIVFDEYFNYPGWKEEEYKAFMEFIEKSGLEFEYIGYVEVLEQVAVRIK